MLACSLDEDDGGCDLDGSSSANLLKSVGGKGVSGVLGGGWRVAAPLTALDSRAGETEDSVLELSPRAQFETRLVDVMPTREFVLDDDGTVILDAPLGDTEATYRRVEDKQATAVLPALRETVERALTGTVDIGAVIFHEEGIRTGPEPRPSIIRAVAWRRKDDDAEGDETSFRECFDDRYRQLCRRLHLPISALACRALQALGVGGEALPKDFAGRAYLGNRSAQAVFQAIGHCPLLDGAIIPGAPGSKLDVLKNLKRLDLAAQGIANEAAIALAEVLPQLPNLLVLDLSRNHISEKGALRLLQAVERHTALREVHLEGNPVPSWIRVRLSGCLEDRERLAVTAAHSLMWAVPSTAAGAG